MKSVSEIVELLRRRGFTPDGMRFVLGLLAEEQLPGEVRLEEFNEARGAIHG